MKSSDEIFASARFAPGKGPWLMWRGLSRGARRRLAGAASWIVVVTLAFVQPLTRLMMHAAQSELNSYIQLVPFLAAYLLYHRRPDAPAYRTSITGTVVFGLIGAIVLVAAMNFAGNLSVNDRLGLLALAYVSFVAAGGFLLLGARWMKAAAFPVAFLIFMVPLPDAAVSWLETASVLGSAEVAAAFFKMTGTPLVRDDTVFTLPGITLRIAQECSGIHSSWVLFITSLLGSYVFLSSPWRRIILVIFVIPLALVRNGFRVLVIGLLCVHIGPQMINSQIHHQGGPIFFALSLVPLFLLMWWLWRQERRRPGAHVA